MLPGSGRNSPPASSSSSRKTEAEKRFEEAQKRRVCFTISAYLPNIYISALQLEQRVAKLANKTHKDRVNEFNAHLESLSEHHDIPKVNEFPIIVKFGTNFGIIQVGPG